MAPFRASAGSNSKKTRAAMPSPVAIARIAVGGLDLLRSCLASIHSQLFPFWKQFTGCDLDHASSHATEIKENSQSV